MRVLIVNTSERMGGAAVAAHRLMTALNNNGVKAKMLVRDKSSDQISVVGLKHSWCHKCSFLWERVVIWAANRFKRHQLFAVDIANVGTDITTLPEFKEADIIHLHWINQGFLSLKNIRQILASGKPVIWTMHDMWPCTGICHHARECLNYQSACHHCPYLYGKGSQTDLSARVFKKKQATYSSGRITFVACSQWLGTLAQQSALTVGQRVVTIPNPINTHLFHPKVKNEARERYHLPGDKKLILFGSVKITDKRKGIDYLVDSCRLLAEQHPEWTKQLGVVVFGYESEQLQSLLPFPVYTLPYVSHEHKLVDVYNAVDLFVTPSLEENLPNMIMEAMACGVPCVGFEIGGIPEMIDHRHNGYVAQYRSSEDFANGIYWVLHEAEYAHLSEQAWRKVAAHYSENAVANQYITIYTQISGKHA